jgi:hypothetical protein
MSDYLVAELDPNPLPLSCDLIFCLQLFPVGEKCVCLWADSDIPTSLENGKQNGHFSEHWFRTEIALAL